MDGSMYNGWRISYCGGAPVTGRWYALRFGVRMSANTEEQLRTMIDNRPPLRLDWSEFDKTNSQRIIDRRW